MKWTRAVAWLGVLFFSAVPVLGATPAQVDAALKKGVQFLYTQQNADGNWETEPREKMHGNGRIWGGNTSIAVYGLLAAGESHQDPRVAKGIEFLMKEEIDFVYALGLRAQVWTLIPQTPQVRLAAKRDAAALARGINGKKNQAGYGLYHYATTGGGNWHHSTAQYGVLGMWAVQQVGMEVPDNYWNVVDFAWKKNQDPSGGWAYNVKPDAGHPVSASMTAAGVATLFITQDYLRANDGVTCKGNITNPNIEAGLKWMGDNYKQVGGNIYTLYGVERIGVASGYKYFGGNDWYAQGADVLVKSQGKDGSWQMHGKVPGTALGCVFLKRGRAPVVMNKLDYATSDAPAPAADKASLKSIREETNHWNQRPRDVANFVRWLGQQTENDLNWQIVNLKVPVEELHDAPILYISGDNEMKLTDEQLGKLRAFVQQGGMILGNADCAKPQFSKSFREIGGKLFPKYEFRQLPERHPIYTEQLYPLSKMRVKPNLLGLSNGVRELMILIPEDDLARAWQTRADRSREEMFHVGANIFLYAIDKKNLQFKGETYIVKDLGVKPERTVKLARLDVGGNSDPEPAGWLRLSNILKNEFKLALDIATVKPGEGKLAGFKIAHLTGTTPFKLTAEGKAELKSFVEKGGTLIIDSAGGVSEFATSAEDQLVEMFGPAAKKAIEDPLPMTHLAFNAPNAKITDVFYRRFARDLLSGRLNAPRIKGIPMGDRVGVFYSREDLSAGLVGAPVDGVLGYDVKTATNLMRNLILYSAVGGKFPSTQPATKPAAPATKPVTPPPPPKTVDF